MKKRAYLWGFLAAALLCGGCGAGAANEGGAAVPEPAPGGGAVAAEAPPSEQAAPAGGEAAGVAKKAEVEVPSFIKAAVDAADRAQDDRALDAGRKPAEFLAFMGIKPGMRVAELGAGGGYTAELLARVVGPEGVVFGQNTKFILERFAEKPWSARLQKPLMSKVVRVNREFDDPLPPEARDLDAVFMVLFYHDTFWMNIDRDKMNKAIYAALKPGGVFAIVDHSGRAGTGSTEVKSLHRIEEKVVREEIEKAGFKLEAEADFLRNPADTKDWSASPSTAGEKRGTSDRFVLKFVKPNAGG